jgi:hypothetical protein
LEWLALARCGSEVLDHCIGAFHNWTVSSCDLDGDLGIYAGTRVVCDLEDHVFFAGFIHVESLEVPLLVASHEVAEVGVLQLDTLERLVRSLPLVAIIRELFRNSNSDFDIFV